MNTFQSHLVETFIGLACQKVTNDPVEIKRKQTDRQHCSGGANKLKTIGNRWKGPAASTNCTLRRFKRPNSTNDNQLTTPTDNSLSSMNSKQPAAK